MDVGVEGNSKRVHTDGSWDPGPIMGLNNYSYNTYKQTTVNDYHNRNVVFKHPLYLNHETRNLYGKWAYVILIGCFACMRVCVWVYIQNGFHQIKPQ